jgi:hypothetical protein
MLCDAKYIDMETNWVTEQLQTIRTLMERSAVYRRALAPIMLFAGFVGVLTAAVGLFFHFDSPRAFSGLWLAAAAVVIVGAFFIARKQALKDHEPFWSPPTRRVAQALMPALGAGMFIGLAFLIEAENDVFFALILVWALFYGCALHAAGFFMTRGMRLFGWIYIGCACALICYHLSIMPLSYVVLNPHWLMGFFFGVLHLAYGAYLYLTEKGKNAA